MMARTFTRRFILNGKEAAEQAARLFQSLEMPLLVAVDKMRESFKSDEYKGVIISIDSVEGAGLFVETEVMSSDELRARALIRENEEKTGISKMPIVTKPYRDLVMESGNG